MSLCRAALCGARIPLSDDSDDFSGTGVELCQLFLSMESESLYRNSGSRNEELSLRPQSKHSLAYCIMLFSSFVKFTELCFLPALIVFGILTLLRINAC